MARHQADPVVCTCKCGKRSYENRRTARQAAKKYHPREHLSAYQCGQSGWWHIGHDRLWKANRDQHQARTGVA